MVSRMIVSPRFAWFFKYFKRRFYWLVIIFSAAIIEPAMWLLPLFITSNLINAIMDGKSFTSLLPQVYLMIGIMLLQIILYLAASFMNEVLAHRVTTDMTFDLFVTLQNRSMSYHDRLDIGEVMSRATKDTRMINIGLSPGLTFITGFLVTTVATGFVLFQINWVLVITLVVCVILFVVAALKYATTLNPLSLQVLAEYSKLNDVTNNTLTSIFDVKTYVAEAFFKRKFFKQAYKQARLKEREGILGALYYPQLFLAGYALAINSYSLWLFFQGRITISMLILIMLVLGVWESMSYEMDWISYYLVGLNAGLKRIHSLMIDPDPWAKHDGTIPYDGKNTTIEFQNVWFQYDHAQQSSLKDITFKIPHGCTVAVIGGPGSGKSTLIKLLQRLYQPTKGRILLGSQDINVYTNKTLRKHIAMVEQDIYLFNDSVMENIRYGRPTASEEEVIRAAKLARAHEFIMSLPSQYHTLIGENGVKLSGGQAQRLAIARAILMNPSILIFDDGASALDIQTELEIQEALEHVLKTRTTIITTHRLAIIAKADKVIIMNEGRIVGEGTHDTLILSNPYYRQLFENHYELPPLQLVPGD